MLAIKYVRILLLRRNCVGRRKIEKIKAQIADLKIKLNKQNK